jgi:Asp-tRNA(Asn)/Glu-tRNA(Gln) amidotransferase A subunit family amidase
MQQQQQQQQQQHGQRNSPVNDGDYIKSRTPSGSFSGNGTSVTTDLASSRFVSM